MVHIAICYFGMTRSLRKVYETHIKNIFNVLKSNSISYTIFMHSWKTDKNVFWEEESSIPIDYEEYKLLNPDYYKLHIQDEFLDTITFSDYFNKELYAIHGDSPSEWRPGLIRNHICALESQKRVTQMVLDAKNLETKLNDIDYVMYIRPDVIIHSMFSLDYIPRNPDEISIPNDNNYDGLNDRFAIVHFSNCVKYGQRINELKEFRSTQGRITSETYVKYILDKYYKSVKPINFKFDIIRP